METKTIQEYLTSSNQAQVVVDNVYYNVDNLTQLNVVLNEILQDSHTMPAFGVSIHNETLNAIRHGVWLKLQYNETKQIDDMPFDELLIEINKEFTGFNIIRGNKGIYEGRCYYIDLIGNTMQPLYEFVNRFDKV
ncbi:MAG: hypothetical protein IJ458_01245 [Clostridia bacterium]|nr:hypothetical protein [Clostridia bacterium]